MNILGKIFLAVGKLMLEYRRETREYNYSGHWENQGTLRNENWQWVEHDTFQPVYINVHNILDDYVIIVSKRESPRSIDTLKCYSQKQLDGAIDIYTLYYSRLGNVVINREEVEIV